MIMYEGDWMDIMKVYKFKGVDRFYNVPDVFEDPEAREAMMAELSTKLQMFLEDPDNPAIHRRLKKAQMQKIPDLSKYDIDGIVGIEMRGLELASFMACWHGMRLVQVRKDGKLPGKVEKQSYGTEYSHDTVCIQAEKIHEGGRYIVLDDLVATGGSIKATCDLIRRQGGIVVAAATVVELPLGGREMLEKNGIPLISLRRINGPKAT